MIYGQRRAAVQETRTAFVRKWRLSCKAVTAGFEEPGE